MDASEKPPIGVVLEHYHGAPIPTGFHGRAKVKCVSPEHQDQHASASVDHNKNTYKCFGCGLQNDSIGFIMQEGSLDFTEAKSFAEDQGWMEGDSSSASVVSNGGGLANGAGRRKGHNRSRQARVRRRKRA